MALDQIGEQKWFTWEGDGIKNDIEQLILESDVGNEKYIKRGSWEMLRRSCKEVVTGYELLVRARSSRSEKYAVDSEGLVILGLSNFYEISRAMTIHTGGTFGNFKYSGYGLEASSRDHTQRFMEKLLNDPRVKEVMFLVPPKMFQTESETGNATREEFKYILNHPQLAGKVRLVFGAYEMIDKDRFDRDMSTTQGVVDYARPIGTGIRGFWKLAKEFEAWLDGMKQKV